MSSDNNLIDNVNIYEKPAIIRSIGENKWHSSLACLLEDDNKDSIIVVNQDIPIGSYDEFKNNNTTDNNTSKKTGSIWKYYIKRDETDKNQFLKITENYDFHENLLIQNINKFSKEDIEYVKTHYTLFHES